MKNLSKALVLAVLLTPGAVQAIEWCTGDNEHIWTFASGQTPYTFFCDDIDTPSITSAQNFTVNQCQEAWDNFASDYSDDGPVIQNYSIPIGGNECRWMYRCLACIDGYLPAISINRPHLAPADAGGVAEDLVKGVVLSVRLYDAGGRAPYYLVDVVTDTAQVQVRVDATTGHAQIVEARR